MNPVIQTKEHRACRLSGSYTVEASLIFSVLLMILISVLTMTEFLTDCVRMNAVMAERVTALASGQGEEPAEADRFFRLHAGNIQETSGKKSAEIFCRDAPDQARFGESFEASYKVQRRNPPAWIRKIRQIQALLE